MMIEKDNFYVITGGPGCGKTTLLESIGRAGFRIVPETAREIIRQQEQTGGEAVPWRNKVLYTEMMLAGSVESYRKNRHRQDPVFFDRGIPDTLCYAEMTGQQIPPGMEEKGRNYRYNRMVFILPPWPEIYETDAERKQDWQEAESTYFQMKATYRKYGYTPVDVPKGSIENRRDFVLGRISGVSFPATAGE